MARTGSGGRKPTEAGGSWSDVRDSSSASVRTAVAAMRAGAALVTLFLAVGSVQAQDRAPHEGMSGAPRVSPSVLATWYTSRDAADARLDLMVLWRGEAEWRRVGIAAGGSDGMCPGTEDRCPGLVHGQFRIGQVEFDVILDRLTRSARILGEEISLEDTNVVLVDRIDGVGGPPTIVGRLWIPVDLLSLELDASTLVQTDDRLSAFVR